MKFKFKRLPCHQASFWFLGSRRQGQRNVTEQVSSSWGNRHRTLDPCLGNLNHNVTGLWYWYGILVFHIVCLRVSCYSIHCLFVNEYKTLKLTLTKMVRMSTVYTSHSVAATSEVSVVMEVACGNACENAAQKSGLWKCSAKIADTSTGCIP